jgi:nucleotide-binding universal stress UspA family protein
MNQIQTSTASRDIAEQSSPATEGPVKKFNGKPLLPWKNILVPVDFSEPSKQALDIAAGLAELSGARLTLLHVVQLPVACSFDTPTDADSLLNAARNDLDTISHDICPELIQEKLVWFGKQDTTREIIEESLELPADLIVISTHQRNALARVLHSNIAEKLVCQATCPVLVIHARNDSSPNVPLQAGKPIQKSAYE